MRGTEQLRRCLILQIRFKHLSAAGTAIAARGPVGVHGGLRDVDELAAVWARCVQLMDEVWEGCGGVGGGSSVQSCTS